MLKVQIIILLFIQSLVYCNLSFGLPFSSSCRFSLSYSISDLLYNATKQREFVESAIFWEGKFHRPGIGFDEETGLTHDGRPLDFKTGEANGDPHPFSAASKESLHVALLSLAIDGNSLAKLFVESGLQSSPSLKKYYSNAQKDPVQAFICDILSKKLKSYGYFRFVLKGFGGFLPWFQIKNGTISPTPDFSNRVPALDNGQLLWSLVNLVHALNTTNYCPSLTGPYKDYLNYLTENILTIFYDETGYVRAVTRIFNVTAEPTQSNYKNDSPDYFLDDPYEGELMVFFMDLYAKWDNESQKEKIWIDKRKKLQNVVYNSSQGPISVQRGWWFSSHEQWKFLVLPYQSVSIANRVLRNCERARTRFSQENNLPGLFASVNDVATNGGTPPDYISAAGIQSIAFQPVLRQDVITPYGVMPVSLANYSVGLVWYNHILNAPKMQVCDSKFQGPCGSTEAININGTEICALTTWDSKITTVMALIQEKGIRSSLEAILKEQNKFSRFSDVVNREYSLKFPTLLGEDIPFGLPTKSVPSVLPDFTDCSL